MDGSLGAISEDGAETENFDRLSAMLTGLAFEGGGLRTAVFPAIVDRRTLKKKKNC